MGADCSVPGGDGWSGLVEGRYPHPPTTTTIPEEDFPSWSSIYAEGSEQRKNTAFVKL